MIVSHYSAYRAQWTGHFASHMMQHHRLDGPMEPSLPSYCPLHLVFRSQFRRRHFSDFTASWLVVFSRRMMLLRGADRFPRFLCWSVFCGRTPLISIQLILSRASQYSQQISFPLASCGIGAVEQDMGHYVVGWLAAKQKQQNGASLMDFAEKRGKND